MLRNLVLPFDGISPEIAEDVLLAPGSCVIGKVKIHKGASVWYNAVIRGDNDNIEIGEYSSIQDNATIHVDKGEPAKIGKNVVVGHSCVLHGCTINDNCLIGMNATVMDLAVIGEGSIIGAGSLITEGKIIPPYSVVMGVPGKVVKSVDPKLILESRLKQVQHYYKLAQKHIQINMQD